MTQIITCICEHYAISPLQLSNWKNDPNYNASKSPKVTSAKQILIYHLYECGMSYEAIAKFLKLSTNRVSEHKSHGKRLVLGGMRDFVDMLPRVTSTLEIFRK